MFSEKASREDTRWKNLAVTKHVFPVKNERAVWEQPIRISKYKAPGTCRAKARDMSRNPAGSPHVVLYQGDVYRKTAGIERQC